MSYNNANKRYKEITIANNTYSNMYAMSKPLIDVEYFSSGKVLISNNYVYNCSSVNYLYMLQANDDIEITGNTFDSCVISSAGFIATDISSSIVISDLTVTKNTNVYSDLRSSLVKLAGAQDGSITISSSNFSSNSLNSTMLDIDNSIGSVIIQDSNFDNETIKSTTNYIVFDSQYALQFVNSTFTNISDDQTDTK